MSEERELSTSVRMPASPPLLLIVGLGAAVVLVWFAFTSTGSDKLVAGAIAAVNVVLLLIRVAPVRALFFRLRLRLWGGQGAAIVQALHAFWGALDILATSRASTSEIRRFEREHGVMLPRDLRRYFIAINGTRGGEMGGDDPFSVGFWHLDQVRSFVDTHVSIDPRDRLTFAFADYASRFVVYGVRLSADGLAPIPVLARFPYGQVQVAATFEEFFARYVTGDASVLFPDINVVADDEGIGAEIDGVVSYAIRWSAVRRIAVEVPVGLEGEESPAYWVITGSFDLPFIAPVEGVAGGHLVRRRIRTMAGFDESAFQAALEAESGGTPGTFVVWQAQ